MADAADSRKPLLMVLAAILIFSTFEVVTKTMAGALTGALLTFYRFLIGGLVLLPFALRDLRRRSVHPARRDAWLVLVFGFMLVAVSMTLAQLGIFYSNAGLSAVIFSSNPLFVSLFAVWVLRERLTAPKSLGLGFGVLGLLISCAGPGAVFAGKPAFALGVSLTVISMLIFCLYTVLSKKWLTCRLGPTASTAFVSLAGSVTLLPLVIVQGVAKGVNPFAFPVLNVLPQFLYIAVFGTGIAYLCYFTGLSKLDTSTGSMVFLIKPPLASVFAAIFLHEAVTIHAVLGICFIIAGLVIAVRWKPVPAVA